MNKPWNRRCGAFTLIELLIVIAIIAVLALIAVPNFLEAQTRARVARMKSELRTLAQAVEAYRADGGDYPPHRDAAGGEIAYPDRYVPLTTPIAYLTAIPEPDVFHTRPALGQGGSLEWVSWTNFANFPQTHPLASVRDTHRYLLRSRGPDGVNESNDIRNAWLTLGLAAAPSMIYDPTNGTLSRGDLVRTAMFQE